MKRILLCFVISLLACPVCADSLPASLSGGGQEEPKSEKITFKFGGRIDFFLLSDTYESKETCNGAQYFFPLAPLYNDKGENLNYVNRLRASVVPSRLNATVNVPELLRARGKGYVEIDFMGLSEATLGMIRLRHAFFSLEWQKTELLFGQTSHLAMVDEIAPNVVRSGGGNPIHPLSRPIQVQFHGKPSENITLSVAAALFSGETGRAQSYALLPDLHLRFTAGDPADGFFGGVVGGYKLLKPRISTADGSRAEETTGSFDAAAFARYSFGRGYSLTAYGIRGGNLSPFDMLGGYASLHEDADRQDYRYANVGSYSAWLDFETRRFSGWSMGIFGGIQQYTGSSKDISVYGSNIRYYGIEGFWHISPRVWYTYRKLSFGLEYLLSSAKWARTFDDRYKATDSYSPTYNNRVVLLARFAF